MQFVTSINIYLLDLCSIAFFFLQYEDDEGDKVLLATDGDLIGAVSHARSVGLKVIL